MSLPPGWVRAAIADLTVAKVEQGPPSGSVRYVDISAIDRARKVIGPVAEVDAKTAPTRARQWIRSGDILVSMTRPNLNAVAKVPDQLDGVVASTGFDVLRAKGVLPDWLFARVRSREFVNDICEGVQGVVYPAVRPDDIRAHQMPVPPMAEQKRIVEALDSFLSRLDAAEKSLEQAQAKLKAYRASVLKAAVEGRLVPTEAELARQENRSYEPARVLLDRILKERRRRWEESELARLTTAGKTPKNDKWKAKYKEPESPDTTTLPELPEGWCWVTLDALIASGPQNGIYVPKSKYGGGTPILRIDDYQVDWSRPAAGLQRVRLSSKDVARFGLALGDIVVNRVNSPSHLGKTLAVEDRHLPAVFESNMMRFRPSSRIPSRFVHFYLSSAQGKQRLIAGAKWAVNQASINQEDVRNAAVPLPPMAEQLRLVAEIDCLLSTASVATAMVGGNTRRSTPLRQAILKWAFQGRLVDQDPNDEPAEQLLARVRAERSEAPSQMARSQKKLRQGSAT